MKYSLGVDIGGTKVAVAVVSEHGEIISRRQQASRTEDAESLYACVCELIDQELEENHLTIEQMSGIGVGLPGKVDVENGIAVYQNNIPWANFPIVNRLEESYGGVPVKIDNDVKVAAYAEYRQLRLPSKEMFAYVTLSTGIAATNIMDNTILRGSGFSGEIGFVQVPYFGELQPLEPVCSGGGIQKKARELYHDESLSTKDVFDRWRLGESVATTVIEETAVAITSALHYMVCLLDPAAIVFGGSVSNYNPDFIELVKKRLANQLHPEQLHIIDAITASTMKGDNGIIGAGLLVL